MKKSKNNLLAIMPIAIFAQFIPLCMIFAAEKIIQQESIAFEQCLNVIKVSESKLSIEPKTTDLKTQVRVALFTLSDGQLKITCDGSKNLITVSTITN